MTTDVTIRWILVFLVPLILLSGCAKWDDVSWDADLSAPLLTTTIDLSDIIPDSLLGADCMNKASLDFTYPVFTLDQDTLFDLGQTITDLAFFIPATLTLNPGQPFISSVNETKFDFMDAEIRYLTIEQGRVKIQLMNPLNEAVVCSYSIPKSSLNGAPFSARVSIPAASGGQPGTITVEEDVSGYTLDLRGVSGNKSNRIGVQIDAIIDSSANPALITPFDTLKVNAVFSYLTIREASGYFGQHLVSNGPETTKLQLFNMVASGAITLDSALVMMRITNGTGTDIRLNLKQIIARNTKNQTEVVFTDPFIGVPMQIARASRDPQTKIITPVSLDLVFDPATTKSMFELFPDELEWDLSMEVNPMGNVSLGNDFMHKDHPLKAELGIYIPLRLSANGLLLKQESAFYYDSEAIHHGNLYLIADNRFPFDAGLTLYLKDANGSIIDSLVPAGTLAAGNLVQPDIIESTRTILSIPCDPARIARLKQTRSVLTEVVLDTKPTGGSVLFKSDYNLRVVISANFNTTIKP